MRLVVISNRVPSPAARTTAGGLAVGLFDALSDTGGTWFGWSGEIRPGRSDAPTVVQDDDIDYTTVDLSQEDYDNFYGGYANRVLWPLFHERLHAMDFHEHYREAYASANTYFADHAARLVRPDDVIWVHDYHLIPLGARLRQRGVAERIGFFLHIPFPPHTVLRALPERRELLESFFGYDLVGFQTSIDARHFAYAVATDLGATVDAAAGTAELNGRRLRFGAFPIGIDVDGTAKAAHYNRGLESGNQLTRAMRGRQLVIGADRLDYTKGLVERFLAFERFLERYGRDMDDEMIFIQVTAPSRESVEEYQEITQQLESEAGRINGRHSSIHWVPLRLIEQSIDRGVLLGYLSLAHVGLVTPLRDGMNLVAKEFIAAQTPEEPGVLILSSLAGAVEELEEPAIVVNPYNPDEVADAIHRALKMPLAERRSRWEQAMTILRDNTIEVWRQRFLEALTSNV